MHPNREASFGEAEVPNQIFKPQETNGPIRETGLVQAPSKSLPEFPIAGQESPGSEQLPAAVSAEQSGQDNEDQRLMSIAIALARALQREASETDDRSAQT
jgi:hypothetical protein